MGTEFLRALEHHRTHGEMRAASALPDRVLVPWIHHDNLLEGEMFAPDEIRTALDGVDADLDPYLRPLMGRIRRYADTVRLVWSLSAQGPDAVSLENLKRLNRELNPDPADRGGLYRQTSPVHRDYYQRICGADKVTYNLRKLFEQIETEADDATDPIAFAAEIHHKLMHIYPFRKQPGTTARLFTNLLLMSRGYPPAVIPGGLRAEYYAALEASEPFALARLYRSAVLGFLQASRPRVEAQRSQTRASAHA
ncbi:MAG: Fic family protein [Bradymonadia bacterium]|jgi:fido (protein-threonine AMPylation protein)